jgi:hypothetical protein
MKYILLLALTTYLGAQTIHSSIVTYAEYKDFQNSKQKYDGTIYGVGADIHHNNSAYKFAYEYGNINTKKPPLKYDLEVNKLYLKYNYDFQNNFEFNVNYINVLNDNIAITDGGQAYGAGVTYHIKNNINSNFTQYYINYDDFNVYQSDLTFNYMMKIDDVKVKLTSITKYINIDEENINGFTKNAKDSYLTSGLKFHLHYNGYHFGSAVFLGERAFSIMDDGFKIQHHALEFDRTYAVGIGKNISDYVIRLQYIYSKVKEMPTENDNVKVSLIRLLLNYKF